MKELMDKLVQRQKEPPRLSSRPEAMDLLFDEVDAALFRGHEAQSWPDIEELLADPRWSELSLTLMIGGLAITRPIRHKLQNRHLLIELVRQHPDAAGRAESLLAGLI